MTDRMRRIRVTRTFIDRERESQELELDPWSLESAIKLCRLVNGSMDRVTIRSISLENLDRDWMEELDIKYKGTKVNFVNRSSKGTIEVPEYVTVQDAIRIFNIGYGRALGHAMRYIREHFPEHEEVLKKDLLSELDEYNVHLVRCS